jgi:2,4-dienoyl-CoA reductase-like NADH-dependent reductase (Old Yellow Enzyme family)
MATAFEQAKLGPIELKNRIIKAATFEGRAPKGAVTQDLIDFHLAVAEGGIGMTTVAYLAVAPEGRTDRNCVLLSDPANIEPLQRLTATIHDAGAKISAQVGHSGPVGNSRSNRAPSLSPSGGRSPLGMVSQPATDEDLDRILLAFRTSARNAVEAGFDCIELHLGHGYLLSSFFSPKANTRTDQYGGSLEKRSIYPRKVVEAVREEIGDRIALTAKISMRDATKGGIELEHSIPTAKLLESDGNLDALVLTAGSSLNNPMYLFRGHAPRKEFAETLPQPLKLGFKVVGRRFMPDYPYEEAYFLDMASQFRAELTMPLVLLGGISNAETIERGLGAGFEFVAMGRALLAEPDLLLRYQAGTASTSQCSHCNRCMVSIYSGTRCTESFSA